MNLQLSPKTKLAIMVGTSGLFILGGLVVWNRNSPSEPASTETENYQGEVFGLRSQVPEKFPEDIPLFEPATIRNVTDTRTALQVTLETDRSPEEVLNFYSRRMADSGWEKTEIYQLERGGVWSFKRDQRRLELTTVWIKEQKITIISLKSYLPQP